MPLLERKFLKKYGKKNYERIFSKDFREAIKGVDTIMKKVKREKCKRR